MLKLTLILWLCISAEYIFRNLNLTLIYVITKILAQLRTNFFIKSFDLCPSPGPVKYSGNITTENNKQYLNLLMITPIPLDDNIQGIYNIETLVQNRTYVQVFEIREKDFCRALNKYMGEFWYDIERVAQIPVGVCPIRSGRYRVHHCFLDFKKITLQTFPFGTLRFTIHGIDKRINQLVFCAVVEVENKIN